MLDQFRPEIGFLSDADKKLILDATRLRCRYFMTIDEKLLRNKDLIKKFIGIDMIRPFFAFSGTRGIPQTHINC